MIFDRFRKMSIEISALRRVALVVSMVGRGKGKGGGMYKNDWCEVIEMDL